MGIDVILLIHRKLLPQNIRNRPLHVFDFDIAIALEGVIHQAVIPKHPKLTFPIRISADPLFRKGVEPLQDTLPPPFISN